MNFRPGAVKFYDCQHPVQGMQAELFIVEGDSAAQAVAGVRDERFQAVLPMQGKPMNAMKAREAEVDAYELFANLRRVLGGDNSEDLIAAGCRFQKVVFLFDPDADGIHCGALMLIYFYRRLKPMLDAGRVCLVQAPVLRLSWRPTGSQAVQAGFYYSMAEAREKMAELNATGIDVIHKTHYRGLASIDHESLLMTCVAPATRRINLLRAEDAEAAIAIFG